MAEPILVVQDLYTHFFTREEGVIKAVNGVSLQLEPGRVLGMVGESGSGKTMTALSILGIVPPPGRIVHGSIEYEGREISDLPKEELRQIRGNEIAMIFQDPLSALNPILRVGDQVVETITAHRQMSSREAREMAVEAMRNVGMPDPERVLDSYPFQLSGGMAQRVMLAMAMMMEPRILIADEPTSALDVTLQADIMQRLRYLKEERGTAILLITHNMGVIAQMADDVAVMYAGSVVERTDTVALFHQPAHPYTWALLNAVPRLDNWQATLRPLSGAPPDLKDLPDECPFLPRCQRATVTCRVSPRPRLEEVGPDHTVACYNPIEEHVEKSTGT